MIGKCPSWGDINKNFGKISWKPVLVFSRETEPIGDI